jgi:hypothetical protein
MLKKYVKKFAMDILPSVAATIIGAYIVNHYIVSQACSRRPGAASLSTAKPQGQSRSQPMPSRPRPRPTSPTSPGRRQGQGHLRKGHPGKEPRPKSRRFEKAADKPARKPPSKPTETRRASA